ncbi:MAG: propanediol utilization protein [Rariglobus sp.]|nr:propanediol utilization protein [Rariglobus sp.]
MRTIRPSLKVFIFIGALAALWLNAPQLGRHLTATGSSQPAPFPPSVSAAQPQSDDSASTSVPAETRRQPDLQVDPATLPEGTVWSFRDGGTTHTYAIAMDELYVPAGTRAERLHALAVQPDLDALLAAAATLARETGAQPRLVLYPLSGPRDERTRRIVTPKVHIETASLETVRTAAASLGLTAWQTPGYAPGHAIAEIEGDPAQPLRAAAALAALSNVTAASPLLASQHFKRAVTLPNDPLFSQQWHLRNTAQQSGVSGIDVNVTPTWTTLKGTGVSVGIVDDGVQLTHPDLSPNAAADGHYDWNDDDTNPAPDVTEDYHGTAVAGLAAARGGNSLGVSGVAPLATLHGLRLIALPSTDQEDAEAMAWENDVIQIKNNSWGPVDDMPWILADAGPLWKTAVATGTSTGRDGLGTIYVWASGNGRTLGDQSSKDGYASNRHVIAVGAITNRGVAASFSEGGAHLVTSAPGDASLGLVTTDLTGSQGYNNGSKSGELNDAQYTQTFNGTSAATPVVSGVIALMLEANPNLGWRDVKEILLRSSKQVQPTSSDWVTRNGGQPSLPAIKHHPLYGGGLINAQAATTLASIWTALDAATVLTRSTTSGGQDIVDAGPAVIIPITPAASPVLRVEHVEVTVSIVHSYRGDLEIKLISPAGVVSTLATPTFADDGSDYEQWTFTSVRHWGESSAGTWKLSIRDALRGITGYHYFVSATLNIHGVAVAPPTITLQPEGTVTTAGTAVTLTTAGTGTNLAYQWSRDGVPVSGATDATLALGAVTLAQAGTYTCTLSNLGGPVTTDPAEVVVYVPAGQASLLDTGTTFTAPVLAAGPIESFQWFRNGDPLVDSSRITGVTTSVLTVRNLTPADDGTYTLEAMFEGSPLPTGAFALTVRPPPIVSAPARQTLRLGAPATVSLIKEGGPYTYYYTGLPAGVTYNAFTGALGGRPTATGTFAVVLTAFNTSGLTTRINITLVVEPLPSALVGVFNGYVARDSALNGNLGGAVTLTTTTTGHLTGQLTLGTGTFPFKGALDGLPGAPATARITVPRTGQTSLVLRLTLPLTSTAVTGTVDQTAAVSAWRSAWNSNKPATAYAGRYTFALEAPDGSGWPAGYSVGTLTVATNGAVSLTLHPADGSAIMTRSTTLSANGALPLFALTPVAPRGSFVGQLTLPPKSTPAASITGEVSWLRRSATSTLYANSAGFGPLDLALHGGRYTAPPSGTRLLELPATTGNVDLEFGGTDVDLGAQAAVLAPFTVTLTKANTIVPPTPNPTALKLTVNVTTGQFSGSFTLTDPNPASPGSMVKRTQQFFGVFLPQDEIGAGFFTLRALPGASSGTRSGSVLLIESQ